MNSCEIVTKTGVEIIPVFATEYVELTRDKYVQTKLPRNIKNNTATDEEKTILASLVIRLVSKKYYTQLIELSERYDVGITSFVIENAYRVLDKYDIEKGESSFSNYLLVAMNNNILCYHRNHSKRAEFNAYSLDRDIGDGSNRKTFMSFLMDEDKYFDNDYNDIECGGTKGETFRKYFNKVKYSDTESKLIDMLLTPGVKFNASSCIKELGHNPSYSSRVMHRLRGKFHTVYGCEMSDYVLEFIEASYKIQRGDNDGK